jgi:hypothetical protein
VSAQEYRENAQEEMGGMSCRLLIGVAGVADAAGGLAMRFGFKSTQRESYDVSVGGDNSGPIVAGKAGGDINIAMSAPPPARSRGGGARSAKPGWQAMTGYVLLGLGAVLFCVVLSRHEGAREVLAQMGLYCGAAASFPKVFFRMASMNEYWSRTDTCERWSILRDASAP